MEGKIQFAHLVERVKDYESNMAITGVSKPQAKSSKKAASNPKSRQDSKDLFDK